MANVVKFRIAELVFLLLWTNLHLTISTPINVPLQSVNDRLLQYALNSLNENSPTHNVYKDGTLIGAQKWVQPSYNTGIYRLTFNFIPTEGCNEMNSCFQKTCTIDLIQYQTGAIESQLDSIKCVYSYPQSIQEEPTKEQKMIQDLNEQIIEKDSRVELDHEVETTGDQNDKPFIAVRASTRSPYCPNCPTELNPTLPGLISFAEDVVKSMDESIPNDYKHKLNSLVRAVRVVPISSDVVQYQFIMEISESTCLKNALVDQADCSFKPNAELKRCFVVFEEQPWKQPPNRRLTRNNCTEFGEVESERKQFISENSRDMVREDDERGNERPLVRVQLNRSEIVLHEQMIPKFEDKMKEFDEFLEDFDLPIRRGTGDVVGTTTTTTTGVPIVEEYIQSERVEDKLNRQKRSTPETKNDLITRLAQKALDESKDVEFSENKRTVVGISKFNAIPEANSVIYHITAKVATGMNDENQSSITQICNMMIYALKKDPLKVSKTLKFECRNDNQRERFGRSVRLGAPTVVDTEDPEIVEYAKQGVHFLPEELQSENEFVLTQVVNATMKLVAGKEYKITMRFGPTDCPRGTTENCQLKSDGEIKECTITVWLQPWLNKENISSDCKNARFVREKRTLRGQNYTQKMLLQAQDFKPEMTFEHFITKYNKTYSSVKEMEDRREIFRDNLKRIKEFQENDLGDAVYGITIFADLTEREFKERYTGLRPDLRGENEIPLREADIPDIRLPTEFDWRHYNIVTPVKNQGQCGSCWAFSVTGNVEGMYARKHGKLLSLSEQELVDCDKLDEGCNGGLPDNAYRAIESLGGLELESDYPYEAENEKCHFDKDRVRVQVVSGLNITSNETQMAQWLVQNGPISIGINANAMQFYVGGISHPLKFLCSPKNLDHGVLIVGFGIREYPLFHKKYPYWIIKNSWGPRWGEQGYYRIYRGDGSCGVNQMATSAVVA